MRRGAAACAFFLPLLLGASGSASDDDAESGADEFRAFVAESREKLGSTQADELEVRQRQLDRAMILRGRAYVRLLKSGLLPLSDGYDEMITHINRAERLRHALAQDVVRRHALGRKSSELRAGIEELRKRREALQRNLAEYERSREAILAARDREAAFQRAFDSGRRHVEHAAIYAAPASKSENATFQSAKGRLPLPVAGRAEVRPVRLPDALGPGVFMAVSDGSIVTAVHAGRVVLTGDYGDLGRSVVIEHGAGYSTLSAQLGVVTVEAGDEVQAGASIGTLSESAGGNLYFEVRHAGVALPPAEWFGL